MVKGFSAGYFCGGLLYEKVSTKAERWDRGIVSSEEFCLM